MENDEAFDAEARMIPTSTTRPSPSHRRQHKGHDTMTAIGGVEGHKDTDYEERPLLSRDYSRQDYSGRTSPNGDDDAPSPAQWARAKEFEGLPWWRKPSAVWLIVPFLLFSLAFGGVVVPRINLIIDLICNQYLSDRSTLDPNTQLNPVIFGSDNPQCQIPEVQALVSKFTLYSNLIAGILSAITSPKLGSLSDRYGRRKILALTTTGMLINEFVYIIAAKYPQNFSVYWLLVGSAFDGLCGSFIAAMAVTNAYTSDCTPPERRAVTFGYIHGCLFTGIAVGPVLAGYIVQYSGQILTIFYVAFVANIIFLLTVLFLVPESLTKDRQLAARENKDFVGSPELRSWSGDSVGIVRGWLKRLSRGGGLFTPLTILYPTGPGTTRALRRNLFFLAAVDTTMFGVAMGSMTVVLIYSEYLFGWGNLESGVFLSIVNTSRVCCLIIVLPLITRIVRGPASRSTQRPTGSDRLDLYIIRSAICFDILGYVGYATATSGNMLIASGAIAAVGGMGSPTLQSALTKHVPADRTGQLLGAVGLLHALARVVAPTIFNLIYALTVVRGFPQAVFVCLAATFGVAFVLSWFIKPFVHYDEPNQATRPGTADVNGDEEVVL